MLYCGNGIVLETLTIVLGIPKTLTTKHNFLIFLGACMHLIQGFIEMHLSFNGGTVTLTFTTLVETVLVVIIHGNDGSFRRYVIHYYHHIGPPSNRQEHVLVLWGKLMISKDTKTRDGMIHNEYG